MGRSLAQQRILITGASSGIGQAIAVGLAARGAKVALLARSIDNLNATAQAARKAQLEFQQTHPTQTLPDNAVLTIAGDVTNPDDRAKAFATITETWGGLDILVNNAGVGASGHFIDLTPEILRQVMEVNFFATAEMCRLAIPILALGHDPAIVNVCSMCGRRGIAAWTEYSASKFAVAGFSEALRAELVRFGIHLLLVIPGVTKTSLNRNLLASKGRVPVLEGRGLTPAETAEQAIKALEKNRNEVWIERDARLMLWINWLMPRFVDWRIKKKVASLYQTEIAELNQRRNSLPPAK